MLRNLLLALVVPGLASAEPLAPHFAPVEIAPHVYDGGWEHFVGGGVAAFDCDGDHLPELYAAGGSNPATLFRNRSGEGLAFEAQTPEILAMTGVTGAYPLDIDGDGLLDLAVLRVGQDQLLRGLGDCRFQDMGQALGFVSDDHWTTAFSATWEEGQSLPTLAFGTYVDRSDPEGPFEACDDTLLYRPEGRTYAAATRLEPGFCALSMLFSDWNRSGRADLRVSNDRHYYVRGGQEQLWAMEETPRLYDQQEGWQPYSIWGMGIASRDVTGDGLPDVYLTSMGDQKFQEFDPDAGGGPTWRDATYARGTTAHRPHVGSDGRPSTGWHAAFGDVNNDGRDDIFVAKGNVEQMPVAAMEDPNSLLMQDSEGQFAERSVEAGIASVARSRGAALVDLDNNGWLDLAVVNRRAALEVFENTSRDGHWLLVDIAGQAPNTGAIGSFIELRTESGTQTREIMIGGGHASGHAGMQHFGLGTALDAELRIIWSDGEVWDWQRVAAGEIVTLTR
ncbi:Repeat domain-containing protein [Pseudooceanicola antarcticus]|uniref:CRTAC1 family protein n=1 Tax=Pseudooceanicola antarcticus TaxID=1247613 RepID=A0A285ISK8_9RHOB|nr:CRTAC1 family protein [Pseudooceanicola antarcticus]PJE31452.1 CRTAC1 family protein [Pseudooceanicola antarcticus]SNY49931.1 Repeat domain-containing protein [Pseudooceanicola antarcticus]